MCTVCNCSVKKFHGSGTLLQIQMELLSLYQDRFFLLLEINNVVESLRQGPPPSQHLLVQVFP